jgi:hypothetical protein
MSTLRWIGVVLLVLGAGFLLEAFNVIDFAPLLTTYWPAVLIFIGIVQLVNKQASKLWSSILILVGMYLQAKNLDILPVDFASIFWPLVLLFVGASLVFRRRSLVSSSPFNDESVDVFAFFGGADSPVSSQAFKGGSVGVLFGGNSLDLRNTTLAPEGADLELFAAFGGVNVLIPEGWKVVVQGVPILGGFDNKTIPPEVNDADIPTLRVHYVTFCGGVDIKHKD